MKEYKMNVYNALCKEAECLREIHFYVVSRSVGINHLKTTVVIEIMNKFLRSHPSYRAVQFIDPTRPATTQGLFTTLVLTECTYD